MTVSTAVEAHANGVTRRVREPNGSSSTTDPPPASAEQLKQAFRQKYRHVEAVHSASRPSCLSHNTTETPSFLGFRNLMVIVLGKAGDAFPVSVKMVQRHQLTPIIQLPAISAW
jgi:diacylglycerol O-acyltransferase-1